jgi:hypothetical protein
MLITEAALEMITAKRGLCLFQPLPAFDKGHLGWKVESLKHFDLAALITKTDILRAAIPAGAQHPEGIQNLV